MKKNIMKRAWEIRKEAAKNFGCQVSEIAMSECLREAWAEKKMEKTELKGSEKQIKWALDIKSRMEFEKYLAMPKINEIGKKAINYIASQDNASFWIMYQDRNLNELCQKLVATGLNIREGFGELAQLDPKTGIITVYKTDAIGKKIGTIKTI